MKHYVYVLFNLLIFCSCDQLIGDEDNVVTIISATSDFPFEVEEYYYDHTKSYHIDTCYHIGDTLHLEVDLEVVSGHVDFVDLFVTNNQWYFYYRKSGWVNEVSEEGGVLFDFKNFNFIERKVKINYERVISNDLITQDSTLYLRLDYGRQNIPKIDYLNMHIKIKP